MNALNNAWNGYAAESQRSKPTHGGTASMPTLATIKEKKNPLSKIKIMLTL